MPEGLDDLNNDFEMFDSIAILEEMTLDPSSHTSEQFASVISPWIPLLKIIIDADIAARTGDTDNPVKQ